MKKRIVIFLTLIPLLVSCHRSTEIKNESGQTGVNTGEELLDSWPENGPELLWIHKGLGRGYGLPVVCKEGIYVNAEEKGFSYTVKLDHSGAIKWRSPNGTEFLGSGFAASYPGTRSVPSVKGKLVYALSGTGHLSCFAIRTGKLIWKTDLVMDLNGIPGEFGYSDSPVVDENSVYCFAGGKTNNIVALNRFTGELQWSVPVLRDHYSYGTPIMLSMSDRDILVGTSRNYIYVVARYDGELLSYYQLENISEGFEHCNSVVHQDGYIYFIASEEHGQGSIKLELSGNGKSLSEEWRNRRVINIFGGFVVLENSLYTTLENKKLICLDTKTGRIKHSVRAASGSIVYADKKLIVYGHNGLVQLFSLAAERPELISEMRIVEGSGQHFSFPVIVNGVMYIRRGDVLMAFAVR